MNTTIPKLLVGSAAAMLMASAVISALRSSDPAAALVTVFAISGSATLIGVVAASAWVSAHFRRTRFVIRQPGVARAYNVSRTEELERFLRSLPRSRELTRQIRDSVTVAAGEFGVAFWAGNQAPFSLIYQNARGFIIEEHGGIRVDVGDGAQFRLSVLQFPCSPKVRKNPHKTAV